jgi:DNA mismatch repair protein MutS
MAKGSSETPLMKQYAEIKGKYPDALLLFRVGDFYETFGEDAVTVSSILGIVLTKRSNGSASEVNLAGFPHHSLETYLHKLVRAGHRVAICDQLEDPKFAKGIVKRGVTELVSPGIALGDKMLEAGKANFLATLTSPKPGLWTAALADVSTGRFFVFSGSDEKAERLISVFAPSEIVVSKKDMKAYRQVFGENYFTFPLEDWIFTTAFGTETLLTHFSTHNLKAYGVEEVEGGVAAAGALIYYLKGNEQHRLGHLSSLQVFSDETYVQLDRFTIRNLEIISPANPDGICLLDIINKTKTPMGARLLRSHLLLPLRDSRLIQERLSGIESLLGEVQLLDKLSALLKQTGDPERLAGKLSTRKLNPREANALRNTLEILPEIVRILSGTNSNVLVQIAGGIPDATVLVNLIKKYLHPDAGVQLTAGGVIASGVSRELDLLRGLSQNSKEYLENLQQRESAATGITSLKIAFNKVFGYYIEVTNAHKDKVPDYFIRKQTLTNAERYITPELKEYEDKILTAEDKIFSLETMLYNDFLDNLQPYLDLIISAGNRLAELDVLVSNTLVAKGNQYCKPEVTKSGKLELINSRHPVIEATLKGGAVYVPNDILLDTKDQQIIILTGPNMSGKSALLRQTALITLMAHAGMYVPADKAIIPETDKIFTRVGASDNLSSGESTFMVEMNETARILHQCTVNSLVILDEIGRGTSTYDGISIAWALTEYIHENREKAARTLFATHYHELNEMANKFNGIKNYHVSVKEIDGKVIFLRKLEAGGSEHSFGIHVAEMAGMPKQLIERAKDLLSWFESQRMSGRETAKQIQFAPIKELQLNLFELKDEHTLKLRQILSGIDVDRLTPVEALLKLQELKNALLN